MKTAVFIPDNIYESADKLAARIGSSRSHLYTQALVAFLEAHDKDGITAKLNEVYQDADSRLDSELRTMQSRSLPKEEW